jgi:CDP-diacylglycerol--glycerol-3-phosphate 3-phosphatidyltransferase
VARAGLTWRRLVGLDRTGPPPPETGRGQPLRPFTLPNAIGFLRLGLVPVFIVLGLSSGDGREAEATIVFAVIAWGDYADGIAARVTGQYSRLGALIDPLTDRVLIVAGAVVCWEFELLPRWALAVLGARELLMLALTQLALRRGLEIEVNWLGRLAVWPVMSALALAMMFESWVTEVVLLVGLAMALAATVVYLQDGGRRLRVPPSSST